MTRAATAFSVLCLLGLSSLCRAVEKPPIYLWLEPEWFPGVEGDFSYWPGPETATKATGRWGVAGPGISAEWSQGGESEWDSMGAGAAETNAACQREVIIPRSGKYRVWVRYVDHRDKTEPFTVRLEQGGKAAITGELGAQPVVPRNDEYQLYGDFSFGWASLEGQLSEAPATLRLLIDKAGEGWRQVDAVLITDDMEYTPVGREKPQFAYYDAFNIQPQPNLFGKPTVPAGASWRRSKLGGRDFSMWSLTGDNTEWWGKQNLETLTPYDLFFQFSPPADIAAKFQQQFAGRRDLPIMSWPNLLPGWSLQTPDLSPESRMRQWLAHTKTPFYMVTNYARPVYNDKIGPATYQALSGPFAAQFLGFIHGETVGTVGSTLPDKPLGKKRREHVDALAVQRLKQQSELWSNIYKTPVPESFWAKSISCLSVDSISLSHLFYQMGAQTVGYELDATNAHAPMRIAFERGAARQYGRNWINYASGNFGDACNYFTQAPRVNRGALGWFHSKYAVTDGVGISWYRKFYYLNYLGGASAIHWEQGLGNQWFLPGPGTHPVQLSPFGRATVEFQSFVDRLPDRGEPYTPIAFLLSYGHGYDSVNYSCKMLHVFPENDADRELRQLFNVAWHPAPILESRPITPDSQSLVSGTYGNIFDVLVDRPERARAIFDYPIVWAAGDVELGGKMTPIIEEYAKGGGTLVVNVEAARGKLPESLLGVKFIKTEKVRQDAWTPVSGAAQACTPYIVEGAQLTGAQALATTQHGQPLITRHTVGKGAVILTLVPGMMSLDERAHPALPYLMNGLTAQLLPVQVRLPDGGQEVMYQINKTKDGWLVMLMNNRGVDKTQSGIARVDRKAFTDVAIETTLPVKSVKEYTQQQPLTMGQNAQNTWVKVRVHPGDVQVVYFATQ